MNPIGKLDTVLGGILFFIKGSAFLVIGVIGLITGKTGIVGGRVRGGSYLDGEPGFLLAIGFTLLGMNLYMMIYDIYRRRDKWGNDFILAMSILFILSPLLYLLKIL